MKRSSVFRFQAWLGRLGQVGIAALLGVMPLFPGVLSAGDLVVTTFADAAEQGELQHLEKDDFSVVREVPISGKVDTRFGSLFRNRQTGQLYGLESFVSDDSTVNVIHEIDEATGMGTKVVTIDSPVSTFSNLTFGPRNELYGIEAEINSRVFQIDLETGVATNVGWTLAGNTSEHVLEYNPDDLKFYHFYDFDDGMNLTLRAETFTPQLGGGVVAAPVPLDLQASAERFFGIVYVGGNQFIAVDYDEDAFYRLTVRAADILVELIGNPRYGYRDAGLETDGRNLIISDFGKLHYLDASTLAEVSDLPARVPGNPAIDCLTESPTDFRLYGRQLNRLVAIDPVTGQVEWERLLIFPEAFNNPRVKSLAFADGILYAVVGAATHVLCTIDLETGTVTSTGVEPGAEIAGDVALVYHPASELLYHFYSIGSPDHQTGVKTIDPLSLQVSPIALLDFRLGKTDGATLIPETGAFLLLTNIEVYSWTPGSNSVLTGSESFQAIQHVTCQPDLSIGPKLNHLRGNDRRNGSGAGQKLRIVQKRKRAGKVFVRLENDANAIDAISLRGTKGNRKMKLIYKLGGANITGAVRRGSEKVFEPRESKVILIKFRRKSPRTARRTIRLISRSADGVDVAVAKIILKP